MMGKRGRFSFYTVLGSFVIVVALQCSMGDNLRHDLWKLKGTNDTLRSNDTSLGSNDTLRNNDTSLGSNDTSLGSNDTSLGSNDTSRSNDTLGSNDTLSSNSSLETNCVQAEPPVSQRYDTDCNRYNQTTGYCTPTLGNRFAFGNLSEQDRQEKRIRLFDDGKKIIESIFKLPISEGCMAMFDEVYCPWYFPRCDKTTEKIVAQPICKETCHLLFKRCEKEIDFAVKRFLNTEVADGFPNYWEIMNCTVLSKRDGGTTPECYYHQGMDREIDKLQSTECYYGSGVGYHGDVNVTRSGKACQDWSSQCPHRHWRDAINSPELMNISNLCRNPGGQAPDGPWCYTADPEMRWEYCAVSKCPDPAPFRAPENVTAITLDSRSIEVRWEQLLNIFYVGTLLGYQVILRETGRNQASVIATASVNASQSVVKGLQPYTNYSVQVLAYSEFGNGVVSGPVYAVTEVDKLLRVEMLVTLKNEVFVKEFEDLGSPAFTRLKSKLEFSVRKRLQGLKSFKIYDIDILSVRNGSVLVYFAVTVAFDRNQATEGVVYAEIVERMAANETTAARGLRSTSVKLLSVRRQPLPPQSLKASEVKPTSAIISWSEPPHEKLFEITEYVIQYKKQRSPESFRDWKVFTPDVLKVEVTGLNSKTTYMLRVVAANKFGRGYSAPLHVTTGNALTLETVLLKIILPLVLVFGLAFILLLVYRHRRRRNVEYADDEFNMDSNFVKEKLLKTLCSSTKESWNEIARDTLKTEEEPLGSGNFGEVRKAVLNTDKNKVTCAVKMLKENAVEKDVKDFFNELVILATVGEHPNIVSLLGACSEKWPLLVVVKFAENGCLLNYLQTHAKQSSHENINGHALEKTTRLRFGYHIAQGMEYLSFKKCIHRDLACRNVLLGKNNVAMVSDFGLSRDVYESGCYENTTGGVLPVRWMAIESVDKYTYTCQSDVWSFGVVLWEIENGGRMPYAGMSGGDEILGQLKAGYRLPKPQGSSDELYKMMCECWNSDPDRRPKFVSLVTRLKYMLLGAGGVPDEKETENHIPV